MASAKPAPSKNKNSQSFLYKLLTVLLLVGGGISIYSYSLSLIHRDTAQRTVWTVLWSNVIAMQRDTDWGNFLAALVAVGGYLLDAWNNRRYRQLEAQMERVSSQSRNLLVPVTLQCHSFRFATLQFVDRHMTMGCIQKYLNDKNNKEKEKENMNDDNTTTQRATSWDDETPRTTTNTIKHSARFNAVALCEKLLEEQLESSPYGVTELPLYLRHPASNAFLLCDCFLQATATGLPSQQDDDDTCFSFFGRPADQSTKGSVSSSIMPELSSTSSSSTTCTAARITSFQPSPQLRTRRGYATTVPHELPRPLHHALLHCDKPHSALWKSYEAFIRHEFLPAVDRIASIVDEHGNLMEPVPPARLREIFQ
jgi:hypothetical protein